MNGRTIKGFVAYPSVPSALAETIQTAAQRISSGRVQLRTWETLRVGGKVIISEILRAIDESDLFVADVTGINSNVMFELGYAIASKKRIWLVIDLSKGISRRDFDQFRLLSGVGYCSYVNSEEIVAAFFRDQPFDDLDNTLFAREIEPTLSTQVPTGILYLRGRYETDADRTITQSVTRNAKSGLPCIIDDPNESRVQPLSWYAQHIFSAQSILAHITSEQREDARVHNAKQAFVCGMGAGFGKGVLMLAEADYSVPFDYRELLIHYSTARDATMHAEVFLAATLKAFRAEPLVQPDRIKLTRMATDLKGLRIGEYIAEYEASTLGDYFFDTTAYREVIEGHYSIFVGRKGTGKSANFLQAAAELSSDSRNLVVVIQPVSYDLSSLTTLLRRYRERDTKGYLVDALWKFLIYCEIGQAAARVLEERPSKVYTTAERELLELYRSSTSPLAGDFAIRLERALDLLSLLRPALGDRSDKNSHL